MKRLIDYLSERFFGLVFKLIWKFIKLDLVGPLAPFILGRELWKVWYPRGRSAVSKTEK
jgi:hypothetical protein